MATESPIRIIEASGKWPSHNNNSITPFGKSSTNMGIEDLGLLLNGQKFEKNSNLAPNRSGSAPPSIEGSFAAIERQNFATNSGSENIHESEEQLRADPSYFEYYWANVNLNPRLPPPLVSGENQNLFRNIRSTGNNRRLTSFDDSFDGSLRVDHSNLSTHKEESDDDKSPKQEDHPRAQSPIYNHEDSDPTTATISSSSSLDGRAGSMPVKSPENDISSIKTGIAALNISNFPNLGSLNQRNRQQEPVFWQQKNAFQIPGAGPPIVSPAQMYQFLQNPANLTPQSYATDPAYLTNMPSGNPVLANMVPPGYFSQQYNTLGGYGFNPSPFSPYATGYFPNGPFETGSPSFSGQCQTFNNFYGNLGLPVSFLDDPKPQSLESVGHINLNSRRVGPTSPYYFGSPTNMDFLQFPISPLASLVMPGSPMGGSGFASRRNRVIDDPKTYSFLEELKSGKGRRLELSEICGLIVEFSSDQHGSRFIQQKLEVCSDEEKESVFKEVLPHASRLITDVFGNYVIQKFFEYGSAEQKRELGNQLEGQILSLSLQMYGCRVIQKALDAIELEQKTKLVRELDGHILKCVRDQNGNHVIQKCIESIPTEKIKFVISSFRRQVAALSTHPYGCRVIQRVLEHSTDELHSQFIVDEILDSAYDLAQDQYGNYVTQHVLERGNPEERSQIVHKLAGRIVQLSQHKFASNVIEKCLEYSDSASREFMIEEIIGFGDGSDNLLVMVKDQFANYVVQKVLQICTGNQREVLLARIKIHLNSLKKYTYGKHIVARLEQLYGEEIQASGS